MKFRKIFHAFLYVGFCIFGVFNAFKPTILSGFSSMQTDTGDTLLNQYFLEHSFQTLTNRNYIGELFSPAFFYPYKNVLTFSDNLFGSAPIYWGLRALFDPDLSYQIWMIVVCVLCFVSFAILMRYYCASHLATVIGAFLFAFGMPRIIQISHQQLLPQFFTPLVFLFVWDFLKSPKNKQLALSLLFIYLQILSGIYLGWFLIFSLVILTAIVCILDLDTISRFTRYFKHNYKTIIVIATVWALLMFELLAPYIQAQKVLGQRSYTEIDPLLPRFFSWFLPAPASLWWPLLSWITHDLQGIHEHHLFLGTFVILLTGASIYTLIFNKDIFSVHRSLIIKTCLLVSLIIFILCLRLPNGWSLWKIIYTSVPGGSAIRAVTRIWTILYFYLLVAITLCFDSIIKKIPNKPLNITLLNIVCIGCLLEQIIISSSSFEKLPFTQEVGQIQELMHKNCEIAYVSLDRDPKKRFEESQLSAMWAGIKANIPVVNGYSGNMPPNYSDIFKSMTTAQVINWLGEGSQEKLCVISQQSLREKDPLISRYSLTANTSSLGNWTSYLVQLPIKKIFSQKMYVEKFPNTLNKSTVLKIPVLVTNTSNFLWAIRGEQPTTFSYRWLDASGNLAIFDGHTERTALPFDISPGESAVINALIKTPTNPGKYSFVLTMVQESVAWFIDKQAQSLKIDVTITDNS